MEETNTRILAKLKGGLRDGDSLLLVPYGSDGPPNQLTYLTTTANQAAWAVYEMNPLLGYWPTEPMEIEYCYVGIFSLSYKAKLS